MANFVAYDSKPNIKDPILIAGLPGIGEVGRIAADFIAEKLEAKRFARIFSPDLPAEAKIVGSIIEPVCHELWHAHTAAEDVLLLLGDSQGTTPQGMFDLSECEFRIALEYGPSLIITLCGYGVDELSREPRVIGAASRAELAEKYGSFGITFSLNQEERIAGAAALFANFGIAYGIDSICLMGETLGASSDYRSAASVVESLSKIIGTPIDVSELRSSDGDAKNTDGKSDADPNPDGVSYFG